MPSANCLGCFQSAKARLFANWTPSETFRFAPPISRPSQRKGNTGSLPIVDDTRHSLARTPYRRNRPPLMSINAPLMNRAASLTLDDLDVSAMKRMVVIVNFACL